MKKIIKKLWEKFKWTFIGMYTAHSADKKLARSKDYPPVYILQMGKVASTSIRNSLEEQYQGLVTHSHHFMKNKEYKHAKHRNKWRKNERVYDYYFSDEFNGLKIISLVREPIGRNVSAFFQTFSRNMGVNVHQKKFTMDELRSGYLENMKHEVPLIFFDHINEYFNIDVYSK
ncbi:MAG: sulfotransferase family 2 domain-containing protein, partial [Marinoscillum sp.]